MLHIKNKKEIGEQIEESTNLNWFSQIAMALSYVHGKKILHRDIKSSNIYMTKSGIVKIGDFGISKMLESTE